jgi:hypothetical protein
MFPRRRPFVCCRAVALLCGAILGCAAASAQENPFAPDGAVVAAPAPTSSAIDRFEFRGVMTIGTETFVTLVDTSSSKSITLIVGETVEGLRASDFRSDDNSLQIESGGLTKRVALKEAKIVAMAAPPPPPQPPQPGMPPMQAGQQPGGANVVPGAQISDEEARLRMQRVAEEIRRRREMRRQMLEAQQQQRPANQ